MGYTDFKFRIAVKKHPEFGRLPVLNQLELHVHQLRVDRLERSAMYSEATTSSERISADKWWELNPSESASNASPQYPGALAPMNTTHFTRPRSRSHANTGNVQLSFVSDLAFHDVRFRCSEFSGQQVKFPFMQGFVDSFWFTVTESMISDPNPHFGQSNLSGG
jgi:hypothetical protein